MGSHQGKGEVMSINVAIDSDRLILTSTQTPHEFVLLLQDEQVKARGYRMTMTEAMEMMRGVAWLLDLEQGEDWCGPTKEFLPMDSQV